MASHAHSHVVGGTLLTLYQQQIGSHDVTAPLTLSERRFFS